MFSKISSIVHFISKDVWEIEPENISNKYIKGFIYEVQVIDFSLKLFLRNHSLTRAADLAFTSIFALVPLLSVIFMIFKLYGVKAIIETKVKPYLYNFLTPVSSKQLSIYLDNFLNSATVETLGFLGILFLLITVYITLNLIEETFDFIWYVKKRRSFFEKIRTYGIIISISPIILTIYATLTSYLDNLNIDSTFFEFIYRIIAFKFLPFLLIILFFTLMILLIPNCKVESKHALYGGFAGTILYYLTKNLFVDYVTLAVSYNVIYGSMAILPFFMLWVFWFWVIVVFSVQIAYVRQNFFFLRKSELHNNISYFDNIKIAMLLAKKLVKDYTTLNKSDSVSTYSQELNIPLNHTISCFEKMRMNSIVKLSDDANEVYVPNIPIKEITIEKIIASVNREYLKELRLNLEQQEIINIVEEYKAISNKYKDKSIIDILDS